MKLRHLLSLALLLPAALRAQNFPAAVTAAGPVAYWRFESFNESSIVGGHATDFQGDAAITASGGGAPLAGVFGNRALSLDGSGDMVVTGLDTEATFGNAGTISAWVKFARTPGAAGHAMSLGGRFEGGNDFNINIYDDNGNAGIAWQTRTNAAGVGYYVPPTVAGWHHLVTTIDDAAGFVRIYWDGVLRNSVASADHQPNTLPFIIGNDVAFGPRYFEGLIDELAVFERALSDAEIAALYQSAQSVEPVEGSTLQNYDLRGDWSDAANPNGVWSFNQSATPLPWGGTFDDGFPQPQGKWGSALPLVFKSNATPGSGRDWQAGDVIVHTQDDANGAGNGPANITWTAPFAAVINIEGGAWAAREIGRSNHWSLWHNGTQISEGDVGSGDAYSRAFPFNFANGTGGGGAVHSRSVAAGDVIKLQLTRTTTFGDYVGVNFTISTDQLPVSNINWQQFSSGAGHTDHWYAVVGGVSVTRAQAESQAAALGGYLATITSAEENAFVFNLAQAVPSAWDRAAADISGPWLGGVQPAGSAEPGGGWTWGTAEPFIYTNWAGGEPNNDGGTEDSLLLFGTTGQWNDGNAISPLRGYVVERGTAPLPPTLGGGGAATSIRDGLWTFFKRGAIEGPSGPWGTWKTWPVDGDSVTIMHHVVLRNDPYLPDLPLNTPIEPWGGPNVNLVSFNVLGGESEVSHGMNIRFSGESEWNDATLNACCSGRGSFVNLGHLTTTGEVWLNRAQITNNNRINIQPASLGQPWHFNAQSYLKNISPATGSQVAVIDFKNDGDFDDALPGGGADAYIENRGSIRKTGGSGESVMSGVFFYNFDTGTNNDDGTLEVSSGTLVIAPGSGDMQGMEARVTSPGVLEFRGQDFHVHGRMHGMGTGKVRIAGAFYGDGAAGTVLDFPAGMLELSGGSMDRVRNVGELRVAGGSYTYAGITNAAKLILDADLNGDYHGITVNNAGAETELRGSAGLFNEPRPFWAGNGGFRNAGLLRKTGSGTSEVGYCEGSGTFRAEGGRMKFVGAVEARNFAELNAGRWEAVNGSAIEFSGNTTINRASILLSGSGAEMTGLNALQNNIGTLHMERGASLTTTGGLTFAGSGTFIAGIAGRPVQSAEWGRVTVTGTAALGGTLRVNFADFTPVTGDRWKIIAGTTRTGTFSSVEFANTPAGFTASLDYLADGVEAVLTGGAPITYAAWTTAQNFPVPADALPNADPDRDGLDNLTEAALGLNPRDAASSAAGAAGLASIGGEQFLTLQFTRPAGTNRIGNITYHGERSSNLSGWTESGVVLEIGPVDAQGRETITVRDTAPISTAARAQLRLRFVVP